jgi:FMN-dependent oxidoreductase (nitrilotriacetate monooxygenase family)
MGCPVKPGNDERLQMPREIRLNAFDMNCVGHITHGMWTHPRDQSGRFNELQYWIEHAKRLEKGLFDGLFLADIVGVYDVYGGSADGALRGAVQVPVNDPTLIIPAMAAATENLCFGVTCNLTYEPPFLFARRMSTLDHLTQGRIAWNIVTGYLDSAARAIGIAGQAAHDGRYDLADEYMSLVYKLWEGSWHDDAVRADRVTGIYTDPSKVRVIHHHGKQYRLDAMHLSAPSPQRTPVLYQAGSSARGRTFAATHAECVFVNSQEKAGAKAIVDDIRAQAVQLGRAASDVQVFLGTALVIGRTDKEAQDKFADYNRYASSEAGLVHAAASLGIDFAKFDPDEPVDTASQAIVSNVEIVTRRSGPRWTRRMFVEQMALGSRQRPLIGSVATVADALIDLCEATGVDGFNLARTVVPECIDDVVDLLVPALQERGAYKTAYRNGTYRDKLFGRARLPASHTAAQYRGGSGQSA